MAYFKVGDIVQVNKDIFRIEEVNPEKYACKGDSGTIKELFRPGGTGSGEVKPLYAKVAMDNGGIKTFRLTSLNQVS